MAATIESVIDHAFLQYIMVPTLPKVELLTTLRDQLALIITPYLTDTA